MDILDNPNAASVRRVAQLARKKERFERGQFLVEGPLAVQELLTHEPSLVETVYLALSYTGSRDIERLASDAGLRVVTVTDRVLSAMADTVTPQGVLAVATIEAGDLRTVTEGARLVAVLHEVRDPGNAGAVLRAADAAGCDAVVFTGDSVDPWHPKVVRATTGSLFHVPIVKTSSLGETLTIVREAGLRVIAADVRGRELIPGDPLLAGRVAWVFGNEARGLSEAERALADDSLKVPIYGRAESLNLATAASVCLYTAAFTQRATT